MRRIASPPLPLISSRIASAFAAALFAGASAHAATAVWTASSGNWSNAANWLGGVAPPAGGDPAEIVQFNYGGSFSNTFQNDLSGVFSLNQLQLDGTSSAAPILAGGALQLSGDAPQINLLGTGSYSISENLVLAPATGAVTLTGSGSGGVTLGGISEAGGARRLIIAATPSSPNVQTITLSGTNTFSGGVTLQSGNVLLGSNAALGTGTLTVQGGSIVTSGVITTNNAISLEQPLVLQSTSVGSSATLSGVISSAGAGTGVDVRQAGGLLKLTGVSTYSGSTTVDKSLAASRASTAAATLQITGLGSVLNCPSFTVGSGGTLQIDTASSGAIDRIADTAGITLRSGGVNYSYAGSGLAQTETVGALSSAGYSTVTVTDVFGPSLRLVAASLNRLERGTFLFAGSNLGGTFGTGVGNVLFTAAPTADLVGGGGTGSQVSILPYAVTATGFATYDPSTGIRALSTSAEYRSTLSGATSTDNVRIGGATNDSAVSVGALAVTGGFISGAGSLAIASGAVHVSGAAELVSNNLIFGSREANFFTLTPLFMQGIVSGSGGLTKSGAATLDLSGANTFTGPLTVNAGLTSFSAPAGLGADSSAIVLNGTGAGLAYNGAAALTFARPLETRTGVALLQTQGADFSLAGGISGAGGVRFSNTTGGIILAAANSYTGPTIFTAGRVQFGSDAALGVGGPVDFSGGTALLTGNWATARELSVSGSSTVNTGGFAATWSGEVSGTGALTKAGLGELTLPNRVLYSGALTISGGTVRLSSGAVLRSSAYVATTGGELVLDNTDTLVADRVSDAANVTLRNGSLRLNGNATGEVAETIRSVASELGANVVTVAPAGSFGTILHLVNGVTAGGSGLLIRGTNLGTLARVVSDTASGGLTIVVAADSSSSGLGESFAFYDTTSDSAGVVGYRPLRAGEYTGGPIQNPENGGTTAVAANYLADGASTAIGAGNTIQSLVLPASGNVTLATGQTLAITSGGILTRAGAAPTVTGGTLAFGAMPAVFYTAGDATVTSALTGTAGLQKNGPGVLTLGGAGGFTGGASILAGTLRAGAGDPLALQTVSLGPQTSLTFATNSASVGGITGTGDVMAGTTDLTLGRQGTDFSYAGNFSGSGSLTLIDGGNQAAIRDFSGSSAFTGPVILNSGRLSISTASSIGSGPLVVNGGSIRASPAASSPGPFTNAIQLHADLVVLGTTNAFPIGAGMTISGAYDVVVRGSGGLTLQGPLSLAGGLRTRYGPDYEFTQAPGAIKIIGAQGALLAATTVQVTAGGSVSLDYLASLPGGTEGRLGDAVPVQLSSGTLSLIGNSIASITEKVLSIESAGYSSLSITPAAATTTLQVGALPRAERGTFVLTTTTGALGGGATTTVGKILLSTPPTLIGGGGNGTATSIVPWAIARTSAGPELLTYDGNGFRPLTSAEFVPFLTTLPTGNVQLVTTATNNAALTINSLKLLDASSGITGSGKLAIVSGVVMTYSASGGSAPVIADQLDFGAVEAQFFMATSQSLTVTGTISGSGGLTTSDAGTLRLSGHNTFTGPLTLNGSGGIIFTQPDSLGADTSPVTLNGNGTRLAWGGTDGLTLARPIRLADGISTLSTFTSTGTVSGPGGLRASFLKLGSGNTYAGPTVVIGPVTIADDSSLGAGAGVFYNTTSEFRLDGDWVTARRLEVQAGIKINTNGHNARWNGLLTQPGTSVNTLNKLGAGEITLTSASPFIGNFNVTAGSVRLTGAGSVASTLASVASGGALILDNTDAAVGSRVSDTATVQLQGDGELRLLGNASSAVVQKLGALSVTQLSPSRVILTAPGSTSTTLQVGTLSGTSLLAVQGDHVGGGPSGAFTRLTFATPPMQFTGLASTGLANGPMALALYDTTVDAAGVIGVRPLGAADFTNGTEIRNPADGGTVATTAHFRAAGGAITAGGVSNTINSLTLAGDSTLNLAAGQTVTLQTLGLLAEPGASATIAGGTVVFPATGGFIHTEGDLTFRSALSAPIFRKTGPGQLFFEPAAVFAGSFIPAGGVVRVGPGDPLSGAQVIMSAAATLDFAGRPASIVSLQGAGTVTLGSSILRTTGDSAFNGDIMGTGGLFSAGSFDLSAPVSYTGPTTIAGLKTLRLFDNGTALGTSSLNARAGAIIRLDDSSTVLSRVGAVPVGLNSAQFSLYGHALYSVVQILGPLTATGAAVVNIGNADTEKSMTAAFSSLARPDRGTLHLYAGKSGSPYAFGTGRSTLIFGAALVGAAVGANTTAYNRPILPFAVTALDTTSYTLATYDPVAGIRPLATTEFSTTLSAGDNVDLSGGQVANAVDTSINALVLESSTFGITGSGTLRITSGLILAKSSGAGIANNLAYGAVEAIVFAEAGLTLSGVVSGSAGLTKAAPGTLLLSGANSFTGALTVNEGGLYFNSQANLGADASDIVLNDATLGATSSAGAVVLTRGIRLNGGGTATLAGPSSSGTLTLNAPIAGTGGVRITGPVVFTTANTFAGNLQVDGKLTFNSDATLGNGTTVLLGGSLILSAPWNTARTLQTLTASSSIDTAGFSASLPKLTGSFLLTKSGAGRLTVGDPSAFTGALTVAVGELVLDGSALQTATVTVNAGATLSGSVQSSRPFAISGTLSPGDGVGTMASGNLTLQNNSTFAIELNSAAAYDQVAVTGTVSLNTAVNLTLSLSFDPADLTDQFTLILNDGTEAVSLVNGGRFYYAGAVLNEGAIFQAGSQAFQITYAGGSGNDVVLFAVPEPGAAGLAAFGALALGLRRRPRRNSAGQTQNVA